MIVKSLSVVEDVVFLSHVSYGVAENAKEGQNGVDTSWFSWRSSEVLSAVSLFWGLFRTIPVSLIVRWILVGVAMVSWVLCNIVAFRHWEKVEAVA